MPNIVVVNPRSMHFGERRATSIDLCVRDLVHYSRFKATTTVIGDAVDAPFPGINFQARATARPDTFWLRAPKLLRQVSALQPDLVCVQEHLRTASYLAKRLAVPVVLHKHNSVRAPKGTLDRLRETADHNRLAASIFVSDPLRDDFQRLWPGVHTPLQVFTNGLDTTLWHPAAERAKTILIVGRAAPQKGITQTAIALSEILPRHPAWTARFILNEVQADPDYFAKAKDLIAPLGSQAEMAVQRPFAEVKSAMESAAITVVPSLGFEPFGRVALEAHAGGSAVISSGVGGLRQVSGDTALYLPAVEPASIAAAIEQLIGDDALRGELAVKGRDRAVAMFDMRAVTARCDDFFESLAATPRRAQA